MKIISSSWIKEEEDEKISFSLLLLDSEGEGGRDGLLGIRREDLLLLLLGCFIVAGYDEGGGEEERCHRRRMKNRS